MKVKYSRRHFAFFTAMFFCIFTSVSHAQTVTEFPLVTAGDTPNGITAGLDGNVWFTAFTSNSINRIDPSGHIDQFVIPTANCEPTSIAAGADGTIWFTEFRANKIGRFTPGPNTFAEFPLPASNSQPEYITSAADGFLWFTELAGNKIATIHLDGSIVEFGLSASAGPEGIAPSNGAYYVWFTEMNTGSIGKVDSSGDVVEIPATTGKPSRITQGPDGKLWYVISDTNQIGRIDHSGNIEALFSVSASTGGIFDLVAGSDGNMWFTEGFGKNIGRITTSGVVTEFPVSTSENAAVGYLTSGPDGNLWYAEMNTGKIARFVLPASSSPVFASVLPASRSVQAGATATVFASIVNSSGFTAVNCGPSIMSPTPVSFSFQTTSPATNAVTGQANARVSIPAGGVQPFVLVMATKRATIPVDTVFGYSCDTVDAAATLVGINTLKMVIDNNPVPDMIAVGVTPSNDGIAHTGGVGGSGFFAIATDNIGTAASLTARVRLSSSSIPVNATICKTNPATGACTTAQGPNVTTSVGNNETDTYLATLQATGTVALDPAKNRAFVEFLDAGGVVRGSTSTAITTQ
jgi:virginiamycin B lyase